MSVFAVCGDRDVRIKDHNMVKVVNRVLLKYQLQTLYSDEAEVLVLHFMERYPELEQEMVLPYRDAFRFTPATFYKQLLLTATTMLEELLDLLFTMRGIESIYCVKGRNYHENREGDPEDVA